uniref:C2H2-type domain-containing protein n=1 Tax=Parascaris univalens TaxID=6257 RepID=A0A915C1X4_PARUN
MKAQLHFARSTEMVRRARIFITMRFLRSFHVLFEIFIAFSAFFTLAISVLEYAYVCTSRVRSARINKRKPRNSIKHSIAQDVLLFFRIRGFISPHYVSGLTI